MWCFLLTVILAPIKVNIKFSYISFIFENKMEKTLKTIQILPILSELSHSVKPVTYYSTR